jgi:hypothetical protein
MPSWILAVLVGLSGAFFIAFVSVSVRCCAHAPRRLGSTVTGSMAYAISLGAYAIMITSGFITHSVFLVECAQVSIRVYERLTLPLSLLLLPSRHLEIVV